MRNLRLLGCHKFRNKEESNKVADKTALDNTTAGKKGMQVPNKGDYTLVGYTSKVDCTREPLHSNHPEFRVDTRTPTTRLTTSSCWNLQKNKTKFRLLNPRLKDFHGGIQETFLQHRILQNVPTYFFKVGVASEIFCQGHLPIVYFCVDPRCV